jgi:GDPmannose 4,6-dehydratase
VNHAAEYLGLELEWRGQGADEVAINAATGRAVVRIDRRYFRPTEAHSLLGDASKARSRLGWRPETSFRDLVQEMVEADQRLAEREASAPR